MTEMPPIADWFDLRLALKGFFIHAAVPWVYILFLARYRRETADEDGVRRMLVTIVGLSQFMGVLPCPSYQKLCSVSAPALIILVYWIRSGKKLRWCLGVPLWVMVTAMLVVHPWRQQSAPAEVLRLPGGPVALLPRSRREFELLSWLASRVRSGEFMMTTNEPGIVFPAGLRNPMKAHAFDDTGSTRPEEVQAAVAALEKYRVRFVEWPPAVTNLNFYHYQLEDNLEPLRKYVQKNYHPMKKFGTSLMADETIEIWERNDGCD
jgi:hypothetical protein